MGKDLKGKEIGKGIYQRKDGLYHARIYASGYSKPISFYGHDLKELKEKREEYIQYKKQRLKINKMKITFGQWFEQWMASYKVGRIKDTTLKNYWTAYNRCKYLLEKRKLCNLEAIVIQTLVNDLYEEGYKSGTIKPTISIINQCLERAVNDRIIPYNPCAGVILQKKSDFKPVKNPEAENQCLSDEEIDVFFSAAENARYKEVFYILLHTGLRSGELCALEWDDIDTENGFIHVYKTLNRITKYYDKNGFKLKEPLHVIQITSPKREASNRYIPMTDEVKDAFYDWKKKQDHDKAEIGRKWGKSNQLLREYPNLIFTTSSGNSLTPGVISIECKRITSIVNKHTKEKAEKEHQIYKELQIHPHLFRHTFTTHCYESGMDPMNISLIVGHTKQKMTAHYTHPRASFIKADFDKYTDKCKIMQNPKVDSLS